LIRTTEIISTDPAEQADDESGDTFQASELRSFEAHADMHGQRVDKALSSGVAELSRSYLQQLLAEGLVTVNGRTVLKASQKVAAGDQISVEIRPTPHSAAFRPQAMPLDVVFEDDHLMVINKPPGLVVHPAPGNWSGTLLNGLLAYHSDFQSVPRAGIVHRLDKDTSGLMVVARTREVMDLLIQSIAARSVVRQYLAVAHHEWKGPKNRTVEAPIGRDPRNRLRMAVVDLSHQSGKAARTDFELQSAASGVCLVRCNLHTGRTHQIRVHLASIGHPLVADELYGGRPLEGLQRQALHAFRLAFDHPVSKRPLEFALDLPGDIASVLPPLGLRYN
jgi:23S rRNA pseudouridine1911/1915/1917 synthase